MLVADTNVLIELFVPSSVSQVVLDCRDADNDWWLPSLWVPEFRHVLLKFLRLGRLDLSTAQNHLAVAEQRPCNWPTATGAPATTPNLWFSPNSCNAHC